MSEASLQSPADKLACREYGKRAISVCDYVFEPRGIDPKKTIELIRRKMAAEIAAWMGENS